MRSLLKFTCFVLVALPSLAQISGGGGGGNPPGCAVNTNATPTVRANGRAETVGDIVITCSGTTVSGNVNVTVAFPTTVTSRALTNASPAASEALLLVNEPGSGLPGTSNQITCDAASAESGTCPEGANVYQGVVEGNQATFFSVPIGATGSSSLWVLRITNLRIDASALPPTAPVQATLTASDYSILPLTYTGPFTLAFVQAASTAQLLLPDLSGPLPAAGLSIDGCTPINQPLALDPASPDAPDGISFMLRLQEGFASAFRLMTPSGVYSPDANSRPAAITQNLPGALYFDETGFYNPAFPASSSLNTAGLATQATRVLVQFHSPARGLQVDAPVYENGKGPANSRVRLISAAADGSSSTYTPLGPLSSLNTYFTSSMTYVYEMTAINGQVNTNIIDTIDLPFYLAYAGPGPIPAQGSTTVNVTLAPTSTDGTAAGTWAPRFLDNSVALPVANLSACLRPALKADILTHSGSPNARIWPIQITNNGTVSATNVKVTGLTLTQTNGTACAPTVTSAFPLVLGTIPAGSSSSASAQIDFSACAMNNRYTAVVTFAADGGITGTTVFKNQLR